jgi:hypothetical protein
VKVEEEVETEGLVGNMERLWKNIGVDVGDYNGSSRHRLAWFELNSCCSGQGKLVGS